MTKKEKVLLGVSVVGLGVAGYFGFKQIKNMKAEIEILKQDMYQMVDEAITAAVINRNHSYGKEGDM